MIARCWLCAVALVACGQTSAPPETTRTSSDLGGDVVARVGDEVIVSSTVARIAEAQGVSLEEAREHAIFDALFAAGAKSATADGGLSGADLQRHTSRVLAHAMTRQLWLEQRELPITDEELAGATEVLWTRYDRPPGKRTVHFVVQTAEDAVPERLKAARALAEQIREALSSIAEKAREQPAPEYDDEAMFRMGSEPPDPVKAPWEAAVKAVDAQGFSVLAQVVPPITHDGLPIDHDQPLEVSYFDATYAAEVAKLEERGDLTPVFKSYAGFHAAMLLENTPEKRVPRAERLIALHDDILRNRARRARNALLDRIARGVRVEVPVNVDALLALIRASGEP